MPCLALGCIAQEAEALGLYGFTGEEGYNVLEQRYVAQQAAGRLALYGWLPRYLCTGCTAPVPPAVLPPANELDCLHGLIRCARGMLQRWQA